MFRDLARFLDCFFWNSFLFGWFIPFSAVMEDKLKGQGLSMEALMGQLGDSNEFNDLKQKVSKIEKSKVNRLDAYNELLD